MVREGREVRRDLWVREGHHRGREVLLVRGLLWGQWGREAQ